VRATSAGLRTARSIALITVVVSKPTRSVTFDTNTVIMDVVAVPADLRRG